MKKIILILLSLIIGANCIAQGKSIRETIIDNHEYFELQENNYIRLKEYKTNYGKKVYIVGGINYYDVSNFDTYNNIFNSGVLQVQDSFFVLTSDGKNQGISKSNNYFNKNQCLELDKDTYNLLKNHIEALILPAESVYGIVDGEIPCYKYGSNLIFSSNSMYDDDLYYFVKNSSSISNEIKSIPIKSVYNQNKLDLLYSVYKYILSSTDYNYKVLENLSAYSDIYYPWYASSVFQKYKVVCDGYVRAFMLILNFNGINAQRIVGEIQPIDNTELNAQGLLHSWLKVDDYYYDPTFDDSDGKESFDYFHKPKECFNLNHYTTGWILFETYDKRYNYIKNNGRFLIENCIEILRNSLYNDDKLVSFIRYSLENYSLEINKKLVCSIFDECSNSFNTNQEIVDKISKYILTYNSGNGIKKYYLNEEFKGLKVQTNILNTNKDIDKVSAISSTQAPIAYNLSIKDKEFIDNFFQKIESKLSTYSNNKKLVYYINLTNKLENIITTKRLSIRNKSLLEYLNKLIKNKIISL
ncbi:MAG: hypothetical protein V3575_01990 [Candidatus Absconditabacteria bacterium]